MSIPPIIPVNHQRQQTKGGHEEREESSSGGEAGAGRGVAGQHEGQTEETAGGPP